LAPQTVAYVRHRGYDRSITVAWQTLLAWADQEGRSSDRQLGLHHSNPAWVALSECRYVACLAIDRPLIRRGVVSSMTIPGGLHAVFELAGCYGELLPWLSKILEHWLPQSGLKMRTTPAFVDYEKNHFLAPDQQFLLSFYLPVSTL
jgi:AraC family transcriptional regulator